MLDPKTFFKKYWLPLILVIWAIFQLSLTRYSELNPWKLGGYGMYSDYHPANYYVWLDKDGERILARKSKLFTSNPTFKKLVLTCRTYPSDRSLQKLHAFFKHRDNEHFKVEVWRLNFKSDLSELSKILVNSYEN